MGLNEIIYIAGVFASIEIVGLIIYKYENKIVK